jgi:cytosine/adenosine deaminase-related metal-dependent hydrolase
LYRKFSADHIFTGHEMLPGHFVLITTEEGVMVDITEAVNAGEDIEKLNGILSPGFVNAHCHVELSYLKNVIPTGTGLVQFVQQVMSKRFQPQDAEEKQAAIRAAVQEMYQVGIVAVGDICNTTDSIPAKTNSTIHWHHFIEVSGFVDAAAEKRLNEMRPVLEAFHSLNPKSQTSFSPHAPYSVSKKLFHLLNQETAGQLITIHNQECRAEDELYQNKSGDFLQLYQNFGINVDSFSATDKTSLQSWMPYFSNKQSKILVHNTFTGQDDIDFEKRSTGNDQQSIFYCLCINANRYIEQADPPIELLRKNNCNIIVGTDSYASNWQLNILEELKTIQQATAGKIALGEMLQWATINGARALQMDDQLGSFEKGKKPGVVLVKGLSNSNLSATSTARRIL